MNFKRQTGGKWYGGKLYFPEPKVTLGKDPLYTLNLAIFFVILRDQKQYVVAVHEGLLHKN